MPEQTRQICPCCGKTKRPSNQAVNYCWGCDLTYIDATPEEVKRIKKRIKERNRTTPSAAYRKGPSEEKPS